MRYRRAGGYADRQVLVQLIPESLFLAIYILDRFLSKQEVERKNLQLVRSKGAEIRAEVRLGIDLFVPSCRQELLPW